MIRVSQDYVYRKNWTLSIRPIAIQPRITVHDQFGRPLSSDVLLIDSKIIVTCVVKDTKPRKLHLLYIVWVFECSYSDFLQFFVNYDFSN